MNKPLANAYCSENPYDNSLDQEFKSSQPASILSKKRVIATKTNSTPMRHSIEHQRLVSFSEESCVTPFKLYKANTLLPGTSNLMVSQDISAIPCRNSLNIFPSAFSNSTRSSVQRRKLIDKPESLSSSFIDTKTKNYYSANNKPTTYESQTNSNKSRQIKKCVVHTKTGYKNKVVMMAQVDLDRVGNKIASVRNSKMIKVSTLERGGTTRLLVKEKSSPLLQTTEKNQVKKNKKFL